MRHGSEPVTSVIGLPPTHVAPPLLLTSLRRSAPVPSPCNRHQRAPRAISTSVIRVTGVWHSSGLRHGVDYTWLNLVYLYNNAHKTLYLNKGHIV